MFKVVGEAFVKGNFGAGAPAAECTMTVNFDPYGDNLALAVLRCTGLVVDEMRKRGYDARQYQIRFDVEEVQ